MTVMILGVNFEKPLDFAKKLEPTTSSTIAKDKNKYFIVFVLIYAKKRKIKTVFFDKSQNRLFLSNPTQCFLRNTQI